MLQLIRASDGWFEIQIWYKYAAVWFAKEYIIIFIFIICSLFGVCKCAVIAAESRQRYVALTSPANVQVDMWEYKFLLLYHYKFLVLQTP